VGLPWEVIDDDGPNQGWLLPSDLSMVRIRHQVYINCGQTKSSGELYARHNNPVPPYYPATDQNKCGPGVIDGGAASDLRKSVESHEGTSWGDSGSHTETRRADLAGHKSSITVWFEALVAKDWAGSATDLFLILVGYTAAAWQDDGVDPWLPQLTGNCKLIRVYF
jgi:hypothetical protein